MRSPKKDSKEKQRKYFAYFILFIFLGSTVAAALIYSAGTVSVPENPVLSKPLDGDQIQLLTANRGAYIYAKVPADIENSLGQMAQRYQPLVYLYAEQSSGIVLQITTSAGTKTFAAFDQDDVETHLCDNLHPALTECQTQKALRSIGNESFE